MVSLQGAPNSPGTGETVVSSEFDNSPHKRKWDDSHTDGVFKKRSNPPTQNTKPFFEIELQLETPLPSEWQRCLDIQSGQIHFYNTRTKKRTSKDPRSPEEPSSGHMSLDLELNLQPFESQTKKHDNFGYFKQDYGDHFTDSSKGRNNSKGNTKKTWLIEGGQEEMLATVCTRCHLLVMLCKPSLTCPNCKFTHPPDYSPPKLFKQRLSLLF